MLQASLGVLLYTSYVASRAVHGVPGSTFAGSTSTAVFPPPGADITQNATYFPAATEVGFPGHTATGDQPWAIATASAAVKHDVFPLTSPPKHPDDETGSESSFNPIRSWGNLSPWFSVDSADNGLPDTSPKVPHGCEISQVHLLHRHGARYPTSEDYPALFAARLHKVASTTGFSVKGRLKFLSTWTYKLGTDILTPFGRQQLFDNGVGFRVRYGKLLDGFEGIPVFRTTSQARMYDSAVSFLSGFFGVQDYPKSAHLSLQIEASGKNATLAAYENCPNFGGTFGPVAKATNDWAAVYLNSAVDRLQASVKGIDLTHADVLGMQQLCAYETVSLGFSEFCGLFTEDEWKGFAYGIDLAFWYAGGPGSPVSAANGLGWVQELVARLTETPLTEFNSSTNSTLSGNNVTFPLTQPIYLDFTHDLVISQVLVAMNLTGFNKQGPLPITHIPHNHTYLTSHIVPFAANLVGQVVQCPASPENPELLPYIRWILNDGVVPLTGINQCRGHKNKDGLCPLDLFVEGMQELIGGVDWAYDCTGDWVHPGVPNHIMNGKPPASRRSASLRVQL